MPSPRRARRGRAALDAPSPFGAYKTKNHLAQAALGDELEVPALEGKTKIKVPPGSQTGKVFRLKGQGIAHLHKGGRGDHLIKLFVFTPENLTEKQRQLFRELADSLIPENMPQADKWKGFLDSIKNVFGA